MPVIKEIRNFSNKKTTCHCGSNIDSTYYWQVDGQAICDECYRDEFSEMVKCTMDDCNEYEDKNYLINGMCESCYEVNSPLSPEEQEGWEHNIRKWNEE